MLIPDSQTLDALSDEARTALAAWGLHTAQWHIVGSLAGARGGLARSVVEIEGARWVLRSQAPELTENDARFRHNFMRRLLSGGLPVPALRPLPNGHTWALANGAIYELQAYLPGGAYTSDDPQARGRLASAAATLGALHQASADFAWQPYRWPEERSASALALVAEGCEQRIATAADLLALGHPGPPQLHIHGDFQPHNLAFTAERVAAIYDFDAARWEQRIYEVAYALIFFAGLRWDADTTQTPALVDDGLDILRAHSFLNAYGREAPPAED